MNEIALVLPALNEAEALKWILPRVPAGVRPVVVDNNSTDGTADVASGLGAHVVFEAQPGFGSACWAGVMAAQGAEFVVFMDADGSLDPVQIPLVVDPVAAGEYDLVIGRRVAAERGAISLHSRVGNAVLSRDVRRRCGVTIHDLGPMRAMRREALTGLGITDRRFGWPLEMIVRAAAAGWRVTEVDVAYGHRKGGKSKVTGTVRGTLRTVRDMRRVMAELT